MLTMKENEAERITRLEERFSNLDTAIKDLKVTVKEGFLDIKDDFNRERIIVGERLDKHELAIEANNKFREKLLTQIGLIVAGGAVIMTFVYEFIKQAIHNYFK